MIIGWGLVRTLLSSLWKIDKWITGGGWGPLKKHTFSSDLIFDYLLMGLSSTALKFHTLVFIASFFEECSLESQMSIIPQITPLVCLFCFHISWQEEQKPVKGKARNLFEERLKGFWEAWRISMKESAEAWSELTLTINHICQRFLAFLIRPAASLSMTYSLTGLRTGVDKEVWSRKSCLFRTGFQMN